MGINQLYKRFNYVHTLREAGVSVEHVGQVMEPQLSVVAPRGDAEKEGIVVLIGLEGASSISTAGCRGGWGGVKDFDRYLDGVHKSARLLYIKKGLCHPI